MNLLQIKTCVNDALHFKWRNLGLMLFSPGKRGEKSLLFASGKFQIELLKNARININNGSLSLNFDYMKSNPLIGILKMNANSEINVDNNFVIHSGCHIVVNDNAKLNLGSGYINRFAKIRCFNQITIGHDVAIGENCTIWDTDAHVIVGKEDEMTKPIFIGNHVWIGTNVTILKGVTIGDGAVIAAGSVVNRDIASKCLAGGVSARIIKTNVEWK